MQWSISQSIVVGKIWNSSLLSFAEGLPDRNYPHLDRLTFRPAFNIAWNTWAYFFAIDAINVLTIILAMGGEMA